MGAFSTRLSAHNMRGTNWLPGWCVICGRPHPERHHVVARSLGGASGPLVHLCGCGNALYDADRNLLHHGAAENHRLWFWWADGTDADIAPRVPFPASSCGMWAYLLSDDALPWHEALKQDGWRMIF